MELHFRQTPEGKSMKMPPNQAMQPTAGRRSTPLHFMKIRSLQSELADSFAPLSRRYPARLCRLPRCFPARGVFASCG